LNAESPEFNTSLSPPNSCPISAGQAFSIKITNSLLQADRGRHGGNKRELGYVVAAINMRFTDFICSRQCDRVGTECGGPMAAASRYDWSGAIKPLFPTTDHFPWQSAQKVQARFGFFIGQMASGQPNLAFSNFST
jgi:hypothetical protein